MRYHTTGALGRRNPFTLLMPMPRLCLPLLLVALCAGSALAQPTTRPDYARLFVPDSAAFRHVPLGLCEDYPEESTTEAIYEADFALLQSLDTDLLRISFGWDAIEAEQDRYDWLFWDDLVNKATDAGITLIPYVCYTPRWNATNKAEEFYWRSVPEDFDEFGEFVFDLVTRYKDRIKTWELWNEPDLIWYWTGTTEEFARLLKIGAEAVRRADPEATVVLGGVAYSPDFVKELFTNHGVSPYVDVVNMHAYHETWNEQPVEDLGAFVHRMDEVVERYGDGQPLWMAEVGYSTFRRGAYVSDVYTAYYDYEHSPEYQAVHLIKMVTAALATDKLSAIAWYEIKDLPPTDEVIGDTDNNKFLGVAYRDHTPKPAATSLKWLQSFYRDPMRSIDKEVTVDRAVDSDVVVHAFEQEDGDVILAAWLRVRQIGEQNDPGEGMHRDTRQEEIEVVVPRALSGPVTQYDELGASTPFTAGRAEGPAVTVPLTLRGGEITLIHLAK